MTYRPRRNCVVCGVHRAACGGLSRTGKCRPCGEEALADAIRQVATRSGPVWERYRDGLTDHVARLWGGSVPRTPQAIQGDLFARLEESRQ